MAGRQPAKDGRVYTTIRLDPKLVERLDHEAHERVVSRNYLVEEAIDAWLTAHEGAV